MTNRIIKNIFSRLFILQAVLFSVIFAYATGLKVGIPAPAFKVASGDNEELTSDDIKGKVAVIFYETKDTKEKNRRLKDELNRFYGMQPGSINKLMLRIPVINCKGVFFAGIWKNSLRENSKKEGITIYGDWDGEMFSSYGIKDKESNLIIIGRDGIIKYFFSGEVEEKDFGRIKDLLVSEARQPNDF